MQRPKPGFRLDRERAPGFSGAGAFGDRLSLDSMEAGERREQGQVRGGAMGPIPLVAATACTWLVALAVATPVPVPLGSSAAAAGGPPRRGALDINTASTEELAALPGLDPARAAAIVRGRPYRSRNELYLRAVISADTYARIKDRITVEPKP